MKLLALIEFLRKHLKVVVYVCAGVLALLIVLDAIPAIIDKEHVHTDAERLPGFWSVFGLAGCVALIILSKWYGKLGIMQPEDYYDE